jgi:hypothetical protein
MFWRIWLACVIGVLLCSAGTSIFYYAHEHQPTLGADPWAVRLLSRTTYERLHYGGLALFTVGGLTLAVALFLIVRDPRRSSSSPLAE